ncbi:hypothetical protein PIB30_042547 [Stylosanthes scabra]|uniref:Uncharacterized protein n=1 Tax=Stylosanthes scabra TaxID=79078 RepID=A0ABU6WDL3_9FABA|nr:hypothetical protein [Stylosanthes scabra]
MAHGQKSGKEGNGKNDIKSKKQGSPKKKDISVHCLSDSVNEKALSEEDLTVFKMFQGKNQTDLTRLVLRTPVDTEVNRILFKRAFLIFIQKCLFLATSSQNATPKALPTLERNWALHVHDFLLDEVKKAKQNNTKAVHGCCYVMMIIYFHETHFGKNPREPEASFLGLYTGQDDELQGLRGPMTRARAKKAKEELNRVVFYLETSPNLEELKPKMVNCLMHAEDEAQMKIFKN